MTKEFNRYAELQAKRSSLADAEWDEFCKLEESVYCFCGFPHPCEHDEEQ